MDWIDITGQRFGRYTVLSPAGPDSRGAIQWECRCDCGRVRTVNGDALRRPNGSRSCPECYWSKRVKKRPKRLEH